MLLESIVGFSHQDIVVDDQITTVDYKHLVVKGSLVTVLPYKEARSIVKRHNPPHNYKYVLGDLVITLHCRPDQVYPLTKNQRSLLHAVAQENERLEVLHNLSWVDNLDQESFVHVTIPTIPVPVRGIIRHKGRLQGEVGTMFGIELTVMYVFVLSVTM